MVNPYERFPSPRENEAEMMTCPQCGGTGQHKNDKCGRCRGRGKIPNRS